MNVQYITKKTNKEWLRATKPFNTLWYVTTLPTTVLMKEDKIKYYAFLLSLQSAPPAIPQPADIGKASVEKKD
jgi:hypothetical protein